jgi:hypothetical protein
VPAKPDTAASLTHRAIEVRESDLGSACALLGVALTKDDEYEPAWRWLAELVDDDGERRFCLRDHG